MYFAKIMISHTELRSRKSVRHFRNYVIRGNAIFTHQRRLY